MNRRDGEALLKELSHSTSRSVSQEPVAAVDEATALDTLHLDDLPVNCFESDDSDSDSGSRAAIHSVETVPMADNVPDADADACAFSTDADAPNALGRPTVAGSAAITRVVTSTITTSTGRGTLNLNWSGDPGTVSNLPAIASRLRYLTERQLAALLSIRKKSGIDVHSVTGFKAAVIRAQSFDDPFGLKSALGGLDYRVLEENSCFFNESFFGTSTESGALSTSTATARVPHGRMGKGGRSKAGPGKPKQQTLPKQQVAEMRCEPAKVAEARSRAKSVVGDAAAPPSPTTYPPIPTITGATATQDWKCDPYVALVIYKTLKKWAVTGYDGTRILHMPHPLHKSVSDAVSYAVRCSRTSCLPSISAFHQSFTVSMDRTKRTNTHPLHRDPQALVEASDKFVHFWAPSRLKGLEHAMLARHGKHGLVCPHCIKSSNGCGTGNMRRVTYATRNQTAKKTYDSALAPWSPPRRCFDTDQDGYIVSEALVCEDCNHRVFAHDAALLQVQPEIVKLACGFLVTHKEVLSTQLVRTATNRVADGTFRALARERSQKINEARSVSRLLYQLVSLAYKQQADVCRPHSKSAAAQDWGLQMWAMQFEDMDGSFTTKHFEALSATFLGDIAYGELRKRRAFMVTLLNSVRGAAYSMDHTFWIVKQLESKLYTGLFTIRCNTTGQQSMPKLVMTASMAELTNHFKEMHSGHQAASKEELVRVLNALVIKGHYDPLSSQYSLRVDDLAAAMDPPPYCLRFTLTLGRSGGILTFVGATSTNPVVRVASDVVDQTSFAHCTEPLRYVVVDNCCAARPTLHSTLPLTMAGCPESTVSAMFPKQLPVMYLNLFRDPVAFERKAHELLASDTPVGLDFEWKCAATPGMENSTGNISVAQVCDGTTTLVFHFPNVSAADFGEVVIGTQHVGGVDRMVDVQTSECRVGMAPLLALKDFFTGSQFKFGVGMTYDTSKLYKDFNIRINNGRDVGGTVRAFDSGSGGRPQPPVFLEGAPQDSGDTTKLEYNLAALVRDLVPSAPPVNKSNNIRRSNWAVSELSPAQINYAGYDAYLAWLLAAVEIANCCITSTGVYPCDVRYQDTTTWRDPLYAQWASISANVPADERFPSGSVHLDIVHFMWRMWECLVSSDHPSAGSFKSMLAKALKDPLALDDQGKSIDLGLVEDYLIASRGMSRAEASRRKYTANMDSQRFTYPRPAELLRKFDDFVTMAAHLPNDASGRPPFKTGNNSKGQDVSLQGCAARCRQHIETGCCSDPHPSLRLPLYQTVATNEGGLPQYRSATRSSSADESFHETLKAMASGKHTVERGSLQIVLLAFHQAIAAGRHSLGWPDSGHHNLLLEEQINETSQELWGKLREPSHPGVCGLETPYTSHDILLPYTTSELKTLQTATEELDHEAAVARKKAYAEANSVATSATAQAVTQQSVSKTPMEGGSERQRGQEFMALHHQTEKPLGALNTTEAWELAVQVAADLPAADATNVDQFRITFNAHSESSVILTPLAAAKALKKILSSIAGLQAEAAVRVATTHTADGPSASRSILVATAATTPQVISAPAFSVSMPHIGETAATARTTAVLPLALSDRSKRASPIRTKHNDCPLCGGPFKNTSGVSFHTRKGFCTLTRRFTPRSAASRDYTELLSGGNGPLAESTLAIATAAALSELKDSRTYKTWRKDFNVGSQESSINPIKVEQGAQSRDVSDAASKPCAKFEENVGGEQDAVRATGRSSELTNDDFEPRADSDAYTTYLQPHFALHVEAQEGGGTWPDSIFVKQNSSVCTLSCSYNASFNALPISGVHHGDFFRFVRKMTTLIPALSAVESSVNAGVVQMASAPAIPIADHKRFLATHYVDTNVSEQPANDHLAMFGAEMYRLKLVDQVYQHVPIYLTSGLAPVHLYQSIVLVALTHQIGDFGLRLHISGGGHGGAAMIDGQFVRGVESGCGGHYVAVRASLNTQGVYNFVLVEGNSAAFEGRHTKQFYGDSGALSLWTQLENRSLLGAPVDGIDIILRTENHHNAEVVKFIDAVAALMSATDESQLATTVSLLSPEADSMVDTARNAKVVKPTNAVATLSATHTSQRVQVPAPTDTTITMLSPEDERLDIVPNAVVVKLTDAVAALSATHRSQLVSPTGKLSAQAESLVDTALTLFNNGVPSATGVVPHMTVADIHRLRPATGSESWLSDAIINTVSKLIARKCSQVTGKKVYAVSSFFGQKFAELGVDGVRRWFVDEKCPGGVPAQDLLLFPAHFGGNHWVLGVIDLLKRRFEFHDSGMQLGLSNAAVRARLFVRMVKRFLTEYLPTFNSDEWTTVTPSPTSCPQQVNSIDCGVLTLMTSLYRGRGAELEYSPLQEDTTEYRRKICLSVLVGECML